MDAEKVHEELKDLTAKVELIARAVVGEPKIKQKGLVQRVADLEKGYAGLLLKAAAVAGGVGGLATWGPEILRHLK